MKRIYVVGTADTKGAELDYLARRIGEAGAAVVIADVGTSAHRSTAGIDATEIAAHGSAETRQALASGERGRAVAAMGEAFAAFIRTRDDIAGIVGIGGGGGTSIVTAGMRELPIGIPKIMVSTLASGDVSAFVGVSDIVMMPSITDLAGLNRISRVVLGHAAQAIAAMSRDQASAGEAADARPAIGLTMFGVTTQCVTQITDVLQADYDCLVFHATGTGGRTMEKLAGSFMLAGLIDITTTEVCDLLLGGVLPAGADRLDVVAQTRLPYVGSVGALDMVNFWAPETVPARYAGRLFHKHNPNVTLMRTTPEECALIGAWIGDKLAGCDGPVRFLIPERGVSALDIEGAAFFDPIADAALFDAIERHGNFGGSRRLIRLPLHINDAAFAAAAVAAFRDIAN
ncbi:MAG: Tm-1-like ATP-binding domain-containing protein [Mesorhizobium sp.]|nr:Tm-1-like ATP-binding domain-containing protein [Mesorhizobium sp.]